jgi:hypothetical protein
MLSIDPGNYPEEPSQAATEDPSPLDRFWLFAEHGFTLTVISIVAGLLTIFLDARWFVSLAGVLLLGIHRSRALEGMNFAARFLLNLAVFFISVCLLWPMGAWVNESRDEAVTLAKQVLNQLKSQQRQQPQQDTGTQTRPVPFPERKSGHRPITRNPPSGGEKPPVSDGSSDALLSGKPILEILPDTLKPPLIPLWSGSRLATLFISVINRGPRSAQHTVISGKLMFPDPGSGIKTLVEMKRECESPSTVIGTDGPGIGPGETKPLILGAATDFPGVEKQLLDPARNGAVRGFFVGCVTYHDDVIERPLHSAFVFDVSFGPRSAASQQLVKKFQERGPETSKNSTDVLTYEEVFFTPNLFSPYYY